MEHRKIFFVILLLWSSSTLAMDRRFWFELETAQAWNTYNEVKIPGDTGTRFSLTEALDVGSKFVARARFGFYIAPRHSLSLLYAPLSMQGSGFLPSDVSFNGTVFSAGSNVNAVYKFNSYRLTYAYTAVEASKTQFKVGVTAKIRDARISLNDGRTLSAKGDIGFVPLIHLAFLWRITERFNFQTDLDAMIAPQGRAEDWFLGILWKAWPMVSFKLGYRIVEGGADVQEVYNFAFLQYLTTGVVVEF